MFGMFLSIFSILSSLTFSKILGGAELIFG
jgi:hypothetical protein